MKTLGVALLVGGMAFLLSGLVFLLPTERKLSSRIESFEDSQQQIEYYLSRCENRATICSLYHHFSQSREAVQFLKIEDLGACRPVRTWRHRRYCFQIE